MTDNSVYNTVQIDRPYDDPESIIRAVNLLLDWCQDNMREPAYFSLEVNKKNYATGVKVRAV